MIVRQGLCKICRIPFTVYVSMGCSVVRIDPAAKRPACRFRDPADATLSCAALRNTAGLLSEADKPEVGPSPLSKHDQRVYAALTREFATATDIALRAGLPTRARAKRAEAICGKLVRYGLAETAQLRARALWRLNASPRADLYDASTASHLKRDDGADREIFGFTVNGA